MKKSRSLPAGTSPKNLLSHLRSDDLDPSRRNALKFVARVRSFLDAASDEILGRPDRTLEYYLTTGACVNCDAPAWDGRPYCCELCDQEASTVRYARRILADGRINRPDVQEGLGARLLMLGSGGYPQRARELSDQARAEIFTRDNHTCQLCGGIATEIDHIQGSSPDPSNLRSLCGDCNRSRAFAQARTVTAISDPEKFASITARLDRLAARVAAKRPLRICDDEDAWSTIVGKIRSSRKENRPVSGRRKKS